MSTPGDYGPGLFFESFDGCRFRLCLRKSHVEQNAATGAEVFTVQLPIAAHGLVSERSRCAQPARQVVAEIGAIWRDGGAAFAAGEHAACIAKHAINRFADLPR